MNPHQQLVFRLQDDCARFAQENRGLKQIVAQQAQLIESIVKLAEPFARYASCIPPETNAETVLLPGTALQVMSDKSEHEVDVGLKAEDFFRIIAMFRSLRSAALTKRAAEASATKPPVNGIVKG